jgi:hypothetical protein
MSERTLIVLGCEKGHTFSVLRHIVMQGGAFASNDGLRKVLLGRFKMVKSAAVEYPTTLELLCDAPTTVVFTSDTTHEQMFLPVWN